jgi:hypothetical protein
MMRFMDPSTTWLSFVSVGISLVALLLSVATYRRAGPRIRVLASGPKKWVPADPKLPITITVYNSGLAPVQIVSLRLAVNLAGSLDFIESVRIGPQDPEEGPEMPLTLRDGHREVWVIDAGGAVYGEFKNEFISLFDSLPGYLGRVWRLLVGAGKALLSTFLDPWWGLRFSGIVVVVDLGTGVQVISRPLRMLTWKFFRYVISSGSS